MLQQTTVQAVIPYYKKFLIKFPNLKSLAQSPLSEVLPYWAGLGYYSRAKNLHQSARLFLKKGKIPKTAKELEQYPGFGPYTSKAVSSIAFGEPVSVLDGNVVRFLCRHDHLPVQWWKNKEKSKLEKRADQWRGRLPAGDMNQAFMEMGATVCLPRSPLCSQCPVQKTCKAKKQGLIAKLPLKKTSKKKEIWLWRPKVIIHNQHILLTKNHHCPFFKTGWLTPGSIQKLHKPPKNYDFRHSITHYNIFVKTAQSFRKTKEKIQSSGMKWQALKSLKKTAPSSLMQKLIKQTL